jgi:hypothetical protein
VREVYRTEFVVREQPEALVIHCSDPKYQAHFQEFLHRHLGLESYELIAVPGGPQFLTLVEYLPKFGWTGWRWVKFLVDVAKPSRAILIEHENCRWYRDPRFWTEQGEMRPRQINDLSAVRAGLKERYPAIAVESYFARHEAEHVVFEAI